MEKFSIGKYDYTKDKEYLDYLEREKKGVHTHFGDDCFDNPNFEPEEEEENK